MASIWLTNEAISLAATSGTALAWGDNSTGEIGDGTQTERDTQTQVSGLTTGITQLTGGTGHGIALLSDGTVATWGDDSHGQLGIGTISTTPQLTPVKVTGLTGVIGISANGSFNLALKSDGSVVAWGDNGAGQLGDGTTTTRASPVAVTGLLSGVIAVAAGGGDSMALKSDGSLLTWGSNVYGQLGDGTSTDRLTPVQVCAVGQTAPCTAFLTVRTSRSLAQPSIAGGLFHSLAVLSDSSVVAWGRNNSAQLGTGATQDDTPNMIPAQVTGLSTGGLSVAAGDYHSMALLSDASVDGWGQNTSGQVGNGTTTTPIVSPVQVSGLSSGVGAIVAKGGHSLARKGTGAVVGWGDNLTGAVGDGTSGPTANRLSPTQVLGLTSGVLAIGAGTSTSYAVKAPATVPGAPTAVAATGGNASISLSWTAPASDGGSSLTGYRVERSPDGSTGWTQISTPTTTTYTDTVLGASTTYFYRVEATNTIGSSVPSNVASATTTNLAVGQAPQGNWMGNYGTDGYALLGWNGSSDLTSLPQSTVSLDLGNRYAWNGSTTDVRALQSPDVSSRRATSIYASPQLKLHLSFPAAYSGTLRLYAIDWDSTTRRELLTVDDGSGPRTANLSSDFSQGAWITVPISIGSTGGTVSITVDRNAGANAVLSGLFLGAPSAVPPAPTGLTATAASATQITLGWTAVSGASGYRVERSPDGSTGWSQIATPTAANYTDSGLSPATSFFYRVSAVNAVGPSVPSTVASATTSLAVSQAPQGSWIGNYGTDGYALLGWTGSSDLFSLPQSTLALDSGARYAWNTGSSDVRALQSPDASSRRATSMYAGPQLKLHLTFPGAYAGILHLYAIDWDSTSRRETITVDDGNGPKTARLNAAFNQGAWIAAPINLGSSGGTVTITIDRNAGANAVLSGLFLGAPIAAPPAPASLTATAAAATQINLSWTGSGASGYRVERSPDGSTGWTQIATPTGTTYTDSALSPSTTYFYRVEAVNAVGPSTPSAVASATTGLAVSQAPQGNWVGNYGTDGYALLGWNGSSDLTSLPQSTLTLDLGNRYAWNSGSTDIRALQSPDATGRRAPSMYASPQLKLHLSFPGAYAGTVRLYAIDWDSTTRRELITVDDGSGPRTANLSSDFSQGAWIAVPINLGSSGGTVSITVDRNGGANAVLSGLFLGAPTAAPAAPTGLTATAGSATQINLVWTGPGGASGFRVERSPDGSTGWTQIAAPTSPSYTDSGLTASTAYSYRVAAVNAVGPSAPSNVASATTNLAASLATRGTLIGS